MLRQSLLAFVVAALPVVAHADVSYTFQVTDTKTGATSTNTVLSKDGRLRMSVQDAGQNSTADVIYLPKADEVIMLNQQRKEAVRMTRADMERLQQRMEAMGFGGNGGMSDAMAKRMQEAMKNMPPQARAQAEKMLQQMGKSHAGAAEAPAAPEYKPTGKTADYAGISCRFYDVITGGTKTAEMCAAKPQDIKGGAELVASLKNMASFFEGMTKFMGAHAPQMQFTPIDGRFPIAHRDLAGQSVVRETVLKSVSDGPISDSEFDVPSGYKMRQLGQ